MKGQKHEKIGWIISLMASVVSIGWGINCFLGRDQAEGVFFSLFIPVIILAGYSVIIAVGRKSDAAEAHDMTVPRVSWNAITWVCLECGEGNVQAKKNCSSCGRPRVPSMP